MIYKLKLIIKYWLLSVLNKINSIKCSLTKIELISMTAHKQRI